jgi:hypothetical protein
MLIAYFLLVMLTTREYPELLGPYTYEECHAVDEFLSRLNYETSGCSILSVPQDDAVYLEVPYLP